MAKLRAFFPLIVILSFLIIHLMFAFVPRPLIWDESVYVGMGKFLFSAGHIGLWEDLRPMGMALIYGPFYLLGLSLTSFGPSLSILFSTSLLFLVYVIARKLHSSEAGDFAILIFASFPLFNYYSDFLLADIPASFLSLLAIYLYSKENHFFSGLIASFAFLLRFPAALALILLFLSCSFDAFRSKSLKGLLFFLLGVACVILPLFIFNSIYYSGEPFAFIFPLWNGFASQRNPSDADVWSFYLGKVPVILWVLALAGICSARDASRSKFVNPLIIYMALSLVYYSSILNKQERFMLMFLPLVAFFAGIALAAWLSRFSDSVKPIFYAVIISVCVFSLVPHLVSQFEERQESVDMDDYLHFFDSHPAKGVLTHDPLPAAYADARFYPFYTKDLEAQYVLHRPIADYIIYTNETYWCAPGDIFCGERVDNITAVIQAQGTLVFNSTYNSKNYRIYKSIFLS